MTYMDLYKTAERALVHNEITVGDFYEMIKPLQEEIQPKGRWIETREQNEAEPAIIRKCSRCGGCLPRGMRGTDHCPTCGAYMREGKSNDKEQIR